MQAALNRAQSAVTRRWNRDHTYVRIDVAETAIHVTIFSEVMVLRQAIAGKIESYGSVLLQYYDLFQALKQCKRETLEFASTIDGYWLLCGDVHLRLEAVLQPNFVLLSSYEWSHYEQQSPLVTEHINFSLDLIQLRDALQGVMHAAADTDWIGGEKLNCVLFHLCFPTLTVVASDWSVLSLASLPFPVDYAGPRDNMGRWRELELLLSLPAVRILFQAFPSQRKAGTDNRLRVQGTVIRREGEASVVFGLLAFRIPSLGREMAARLEEGPYMNYLSLLAADPQTRMRVPTKDVIRALKIISATSGFSSTFHLEPAYHRLTIIGKDLQTQEETTPEVINAIEAEGQEVKFYLWTSHILDIFASFKTPSAVIECSPVPKHSVMITSDESHGGVIFLHLEMPHRPAVNAQED